MKILFVVKSKTIETLGPMYLAAVVKQVGHEAKIVDINSAWPEALSWNADIIGYSIMTGDQKRFSLVNRTIQDRKKIITLVGGPDPCFFPQGYEWADHVVRGEGENWMADFLASKRLKTDAYPDIDSIPWPAREDFPDMKIRDFISSRGCPFNCSYCFNDKWAEMFPDIPRVRTRSAKDVIAEINSVSPEFVYFKIPASG